MALGNALQALVDPPDNGTICSLMEAMEKPMEVIKSPM
jgi:hypothetical protein